MDRSPRRGLGSLYIHLPGPGILLSAPSNLSFWRIPDFGIPPELNQAQATMTGPIPRTAVHAYNIDREAASGCCTHSTLQGLWTVTEVPETPKSLIPWSSLWQLSVKICHF